MFHSIARLGLVIAIILLPMSLRWDGLIAPASAVEGHCVLYCDSPSSSSSSGGYGGYGGGCATSQDYTASYTPAQTDWPSPDYANVIEDSDGYLSPAPGCDWRYPDNPDDYQVVCTDSYTPGGWPSPTYANVIEDSDGYLSPAPGCEWLYPDNPDDYQVVCTGQTAGGANSCQYANDGECDEPGIGFGYCEAGTDTNDCRNAGSFTGLNTCEWAYDGMCDEPSICTTGTDSYDCRGVTDNYDCSECGRGLVNDVEAGLYNSANLRQYVYQSTAKYQNCMQVLTAVAGQCAYGFGQHLNDGIWRDCQPYSDESAFRACVETAVYGARLEMN